MSSLRRPAIAVLSRAPGLLSSLRGDATFDVVEIPVPEGTGIEFGEVAHEKLPAASLSLLREAEILLADPGLVQKYNVLYDLPKLKWMQSTWAGVDSLMSALDRTKPLPTFRLTRFGGVFGEQIANYVVGRIVAQERHFTGILAAQHQAQWKQDAFDRFRVLSELTIGIIGLGDIGREVARVAKAMRMKVLGLVSRPVSEDRRSPDVDQYFTTLSELPGLLAESDYVVSILPSTPATRWVLSGDTLQPCQKKKSIFINVGRGDVIDEQSIINALDQGWLSHAILDVFQKEPLSSSSPLWGHPKITITPHIAGITQEVSKVVMKNFENYVSGKPLQYEVSWERGY